MESNLKILLMTNRSEYLIGKITELDEEPSILIEKCFKISPEGKLEPFPAFASQRDLFLTSDSIFTIVDPNKAVLELFLDKEKSEPTTE